MTASETLSSITGFTHEEMTQFVLNHFEEFVNRKNIDIGDEIGRSTRLNSSHSGESRMPSSA